MTFAHYCTCGAKWVGTITPDADYQSGLELFWEPDHSAPGHQPTDAATAGRIRRKADAEERAETHAYLRD